MNGNRLLLDEATGEIIKVIEKDDKVNIVRKSQIDYLHSVSQLNKNDCFIKNIRDKTILLFKELTQQEAYFLMYIINYICQDSGLLKYNNGVPVTVESLSNDMNLSTKTIYKLIKSLTNKGVVAKIKIDKEKYFAINPYLYRNGNKALTCVIKSFENTKWSN